MSSGLQVFNSSSSLILDVSSYIHRLHGVYAIPLIAKRTQYVLTVTGYVVGLDWSMQLTGNMHYIRVTEQADRIVFFNESYYSSYGDFTTVIFRRK